MKPLPEKSPQEVLAGLIERVTYHNAENDFCVLRATARGHRDVVTVVGHAAAIAAGAWINACLAQNLQRDAITGGAEGPGLRPSFPQLWIGVQG